MSVRSIKYLFSLSRHETLQFILKRWSCMLSLNWKGCSNFTMLKKKYRVFFFFFFFAFSLCRNVHDLRFDLLCAAAALRAFGYITATTTATADSLTPWLSDPCNKDSQLHLQLRLQVGMPTPVWSLCLQCASLNISLTFRMFVPLALKLPYKMRLVNNQMLSLCLFVCPSTGREGGRDYPLSIVLPAIDNRKLPIENSWTWKFPNLFYTFKSQLRIKIFAIYDWLIWLIGRCFVKSLTILYRNIFNCQKSLLIFNLASFT